MNKNGIQLPGERYKLGQFNLIDFSVKLINGKHGNCTFFYVYALYSDDFYFGDFYGMIQ